MQHYENNRSAEIDGQVLCKVKDSHSMMTRCGTVKTARLHTHYDINPFVRIGIKSLSFIPVCFAGFPKLKNKKERKHTVHLFQKSSLVPLPLFPIAEGPSW